MTSTVALLATQPETVFRDYHQLLNLAGYQSVLDRDRETALKINISWHFFYPGCSTTPWQLEGVICAMRADGYDLNRIHACHNRTVVVSSKKGERTNKHLDVVQRYGLRNVHLYEGEKWVPIREAVGDLADRFLVLNQVYPNGFSIPERFIGENIIHLPTAKTHVFTTMTGAMKNAFGGLLNERRHWTHPVIHETLVDLLMIQRKIHPGIFCIMDGTFAGDGPGPRCMVPHVKNVILASSDPVAIDAVAARLMGFDPLRDVRCIRLAHERGLGVGDPREIEVVGQPEMLEHPWNFVGPYRRMTFASRMQHAIYWGKLKGPVEWSLKTWLAPWAYAASVLYHDYYWYPFIGRKRVEQALASPWGKLFASYEATPVTDAGYGPAAPEQVPAASVTTTSPRAQTASFLASLALVGALAAYVIGSGACRVSTYFVHDTPVLLDGGWRVLCGQIPHNDFYCPLGALVPYLTAAGLRLSFSADAVTYAGLILYALCVPALYFIGKDRLPAFWLAVLAFYLGSFLVAPRPHGSPGHILGYAMAYNRWEEVLVSVICLLFLQPIRPQRPLQRLAEWTLAGCLLGLCAFGKINYFAVALGAFVFILALRRPGWRAVGALVGFGLVVLIFATILGVQLPRMAADHWMMMRAHSPDSGYLELAAKISGRDDYEGIAPSGLVTVGSLLLLAWTSATGQARREAPLVAVFLLLAGWALYAVNAQFGSLVVSSLAPLYLLEIHRRTLEESPPSSSRMRFLIAVVLAIVLPVGVVLKDASAVMQGAAWARAESNQPGNHIDGRVLATFVYPCAEDNDYIDYVNQGLALLRRHPFKSGKILAFDFANPFSIALGVPPPRGDSVWWHELRNASEQVHPPAEQLFADIEVILIPKHVEKFNWQAKPMLERIYGTYVSSHFVRKDENKRWLLMIRAEPTASRREHAPSGIAISRSIVSLARGSKPVLELEPHLHGDVGVDGLGVCFTKGATSTSTIRSWCSAGRVKNH